ncbi:MAG: triose-phosphate isomerase [Omnitrophica WOR_2 bacterium RIFCSPHIGHO2_02_FULL_45_21]|nr:MAG: triose-phosphate isomerase [Omnitrophica WOR_2 bacterium RIFCSPHIGHO2_02_FULL_45_21]
MKRGVTERILSLLMIFSLVLQQAVFAQGIGQLDLSRYTGAFSNPEPSSRPLLLRYFSYDSLTDNFQLLLDKGNLKKIEGRQFQEQGQELLKYFLVGVALPDDNFWVNLRPDSEEQIIDEELAKTELGKALLEADLQLKKDLAKFTSPQTAEGREYWNKLYKKAGEIFKSENITIPTLTRPWIVPGEVIIRESASSAYIYKAGLKVMLEQDHLKNSPDYKFSDPRLKELNEYSSQLIRDKIIPKLTKEVNSSSRYAALRQVFYSLILSRWFKARFAGKPGLYPRLINSGNLSGLTSKEAWSKTAYFKEYQKSFSGGEYNLKEQVNTESGPTIRTYFSGGVSVKSADLNIPVRLDPASPVGTFRGSSPVVNAALRNGMVAGSGSAADGELEITGASSPIQIRNELTVPEGQPKGFFTNDYHSYNIAELLAGPVEQIPDVVVNAVRRRLGRDIAEGRILSAVVLDSGATEIDIHVTHRYGELNSAVQRLILEAMKEGVLKAKELGHLRQDIDVVSMSLADLAKALRLKYQPHSITERAAEPVVIAKISGAGIGAANIKLYHEFFVPGATPLQKLGFVPVVGEKDKNVVRGFRAVVRRVEDVLKGNFDGPVWEFEKSAATSIKGKFYPSKDESLELLAFASQPNDFLITAIYPVEGSLLAAKEPVVSVVYQPVYAEDGNLRTMNPTFICKSQSGADAVAGVAGMFYDVNFVPGGPNGERYVATRPATLKEARKAPKPGTAHVVVYGWQSKGDGVIPVEKDGVIDHVAINPPALNPERKLADWLASIMTTHQYDQPYLTPFAAQEQVEPIRKEQSYLFSRAPKEADIDPIMNEVEAQVASGEFLSVTDDKADMGGKLGHNFTPEYMLAIDRATAMEAVENGLLNDGNIIGFTDKMRLRKGTTVSIGDDSHILMLGDKSRNSAESHQLSFLAFTRGYYAAVVNGEKPYGLAQDYQGKEAKAAKANPVFYSHFTPRFFEILREVMPLDYMGMVDKMEEGWKKWQETSETVKLPDPFSGNVSQQGIGSARYLVNIAGGEREFGILAGDKMGPAALNRPIREGVYAALAAGEFANGLVFEIWDAKAFDEHGNIPVNEIPEGYADIADAVSELKDDAGNNDTAAQDLVKGYYKDGILRGDLSAADKEKLAALIKKSGFVPTKRIFLDAQEDKAAIYLYLADSDRFNIKQVWSKRASGWDIDNPQYYLLKPVLGSSVTKLGILAGGEYIGKDDPVMVGNMNLMKHIFDFLRTEPLIIQGDMNGSHWLAAIPTASKYAVANKESHPILVGQIYTLSENGQTLASIDDVFGKKDYAPVRNKMFKFNFEFKRAQLGGQIEPYGTNWRTVEASYPLAKLLRALQEPNSPFLVNNKPEAERQSRPIGMLSERVELFKVATAASSPIESSPSAASSPLSSSPIAKRTPLVGGNWKMAIGSKDEARNLLLQLAGQVIEQGAVETAIAPSDLHIPIVSETLGELVKEGKIARGSIKIAAQNMYAEEKGAFTGGTSAAQLKDLGVTHVILGHSELRRNPRQEPTGESNANVNRKVKTALANGLIPIVVVGESDAERTTAEQEYEVVLQMLLQSLADISHEDAAKVVVAYEPVWAIGTGKTAYPGQAEKMHKLIRGTLSWMFGQKSADKIRILYGGSVTAEKAETFMAQPDIDGFLVGGASLKADSFSSIVQKVAAAGDSAGASASSPAEDPQKVGGIDFRVIPMLTQPMGNLSGLSFNLPKLSNLENINLGDEFNQLQKLLAVGILPSGDRLKEYVAACYQKGEFNQYLDGIVGLVKDTCKLEEEQVAQSANELKEALLILEAIS